MNQNREKWVDICKGFAMIAVVLGHVGTSYHNSNLYLDSFLVNYVISLVYSFHMPLFFVLSGYLVSLSKRQENSNLNSVLMNKIVSYGIPYLIFSIGGWLIKTLLAELVNNKVSLSDLYMLFLFPMGSKSFMH